jgi:predicted nucleic acid-binding protein
MRSIIQYIDEGAVAGFSSTVTLTEVLTQPIKMGNARLVSMYRDILVQSRNFTLISINVAVAERAADLRARYNLKTPDALQVAVALHAGCDAFLSNDSGLKRVTEIRVLLLDELE